MTGAALTKSARGIAAIDAHGRTRGVVAYDLWTKNSCQAHMAVDAPVVWRHLLPDVFEYPFAHVGVLLGVIPAGNLKSNRMVQALGFELQTRIKDGADVGEDLVIWRMLRENCRWLAPRPQRAKPGAQPPRLRTPKEPHEQQVSPTPA